MTVTTVATVKYQEIHPLSPAGPWTDERVSLGRETFYPRQV